MSSTTPISALNVSGSNLPPASAPVVKPAAASAADGASGVKGKVAAIESENKADDPKGPANAIGNDVPPAPASVVKPAAAAPAPVVKPAAASAADGAPGVKAKAAVLEASRNLSPQPDSKRENPTGPASVSAGRSNSPAHYNRTSSNSGSAAGEPLISKPAPQPSMKTAKKTPFWQTGFGKGLSLVGSYIALPFVLAYRGLRLIGRGIAYPFKAIYNSSSNWLFDWSENSLAKNRASETGRYAKSTDKIDSKYRDSAGKLEGEVNALAGQLAKAETAGKGSETADLKTATVAAAPKKGWVKKTPVMLPTADVPYPVSDEALAAHEKALADYMNMVTHSGAVLNTHVLRTLTAAFTFLKLAAAGQKPVPVEEQVDAAAKMDLTSTEAVVDKFVFDGRQEGRKIYSSFVAEDKEGDDAAAAKAQRPVMYLRNHYADLAKTPNLDPKEKARAEMSVKVLNGNSNLSSLDKCDAERVAEKARHAQVGAQLDKTNDELNERANKLGRTRMIPM